jgi:glycosyltransferase involved in cell wall biosynthesis
MNDDQRHEGKVLIIGPIPRNGNYIGGIGTLISTLLRAWNLVRPVAFYNTDSGPRDYGSTGRVNVRNLRRFVLNAVGIARAVRRERPALVHLHTSRHWALMKDLVLAGLVQLTGRCKLVGHIHSASYAGLLIGGRQRGRALQLRLLLAVFDRIILMSESIKREIVAQLGPGVRKRFESAARVVYNSVEIPPPSAIQTTEDGVVTFLFLGNVGPKKGIFDLIAAADRLRSSYQNAFRLIVAGPCDSPAVGAELRRQIQQAELSKCIELTGPVAGHKKEAFFRQADVFVLPSYAEGLPIAMLEAMSYGLPVVAARVGGIPEVLRDGEAGILIEPGDVEGICGAMRRMCSSGEMRERMGRCGRACAERDHTPGRFMRELQTLYDEMLAHPGSSRIAISEPAFSAQRADGT